MNEPFGTAGGSTRVGGTGGISYCKRCGHIVSEHPQNGKCLACPGCNGFVSEHIHD